MTSADSDSFAVLPLPASQVESLAAIGLQQMTPIQALALPIVLAGGDVVAQAKTGSGKTAAFGIGLLHHLNQRFFGVQALVLCPTRELADQVGKEVRRLAQGMANIKLVSLCGGKPFGPQKATLANGAHIVVGTPGRVLDHLRRGTLVLDGLRTLVLDEADRMLDMGFAEAIAEVVRHAPAKRQTLLFSATYPDEISKISSAIQHKPQRIVVDDKHDAGVINQVFYEVRKHERNATLRLLFEHYQLQSALVFCHTKLQVDAVVDYLNANGVRALGLHGDYEQRDRDRVLVRFSNRSCPVLVATDVAARGLNIEFLEAVINYELPRDPDIYVHRIGRTGRAGRTGLAFSLFVEAEQVRINAIEKVMGEPCICDVPASLDARPEFRLMPQMVTVEIDAGRKQKLRAGDILGALTGDAGLPASVVGRIDILDRCTFVAIASQSVREVLDYLSAGKVKGRGVRARTLG